MEDPKETATSLPSSDVVYDANNTGRYLFFFGC
jgi:hypothetical protein